MARIIENKKGRRLIELSVYDVLSVVREYQEIIAREKRIEEIEERLKKRLIFLPEEV